MIKEADPYEVLGVDREATPEQIRRAFTRQAMMHHPDRNLDDVEGAKDRFQHIQGAYEILSDAEKRAAYDRSGTVSSSFNFDDFDPFGLKATEDRKKRCFEEALRCVRDKKTPNPDDDRQVAHYYDAIQFGLRMNTRRRAEEFFRNGSPGYYAGTNGLKRPEIDLLLQLWDQRAAQQIAQTLPALTEERGRLAVLLTSRAGELREEISTLQAAADANEQTAAMLKAYVGPYGGPVKTLFDHLRSAIERKLSADGENAGRQRSVTAYKAEIDLMRQIDAAPGPHLADQWQEIKDLIEKNVTSRDHKYGVVVGQVRSALQYGRLTADNLSEILDEKKLAPGLLDGKKRTALVLARHKLADLLPRLAGVSSISVYVFSGREQFDKDLAQLEGRHTGLKAELAASRSSSEAAYLAEVKRAGERYRGETTKARSDFNIYNRDKITETRLGTREGLGEVFSPGQLKIIKAVEEEAALPKIAEMQEALTYFSDSKMRSVSHDLSTQSYEQSRRARELRGQLETVERLQGSLAREVTEPAHLKMLETIIAEAQELAAKFPQPQAPQPKARAGQRPRV